MKDSTLKISIVMPSYNQAQYLEAAILSVLNQDYPNLELIVVDGGSNDGSVAILEHFDDRISSWISEPDTGQSDALNKGFAMISGDVIGWLNSDDTYQPGTFNSVASLFENSEIGVAMCDRFGLMEADGTIYDFKANSYVDRKTLIRYWTTNGMTINQPSIFFRSGLLDRSTPAFRLDLHYAMDYDLWLRLSKKCPVNVVEGHWANYRFHDTSKSGTGFGKFFPEWYAVSSQYWGSATTFDWWGNWFSYVFHHYGLRAISGVSRRARKLLRV